MLHVQLANKWPEAHHERLKCHLVRRGMGRMGGEHCCSRRACSGLGSSKPRCGRRVEKEQEDVMRLSERAYRKFTRSTFRQRVDIFKQVRCCAMHLLRSSGSTWQLGSLQDSVEARLSGHQASPCKAHSLMGRDSPAGMHCSRSQPRLMYA